MNRSLCKEEANVAFGQEKDPLVDDGSEKTEENGNLREQLAFSTGNEKLAQNQDLGPSRTLRPPLEGPSECVKAGVN